MNTGPSDIFTSANYPITEHLWYTSDSEQLLGGIKMMLLFFLPRVSNPLACKLKFPHDQLGQLS